MRRTREYGFDNLRGILMFLVVLGHLLENSVPFPGSGFLYRTIYSFHMPAFLFLTGYFARYEGKKIVFGLFIPYVLFQTAYTFFDCWLTGEETALQYTTPYWILWYLMACIFYHGLLPLYDVRAERRFLALGITICLALAAGWDGTVDYHLSLSRFLVFQPWFLLGYYCGQEQWIPAVTRWIGQWGTTPKWLLAGAVCLCVLLMQLTAFSPEILYGANPYEQLGYGPLERGFAALTALAWIGFCLLVLLPWLRWRIPMLTALGQNTMPVYLLHGFAVRYIGRFQPGMLATPLHILTVTLLILAVLGNPLIGNVFRSLFSGRRPERLWKMRK